MYTILIVEDDKSLSNGIALALRDPELTFVQAFDIQNAAELYKTQNIALVILDLNLPDGSGLDFLRSVRQSSDTPVLFYSGQCVPDSFEISCYQNKKRNFQWKYRRIACSHPPALWRKACESVYLLWHAAP